MPFAPKPVHTAARVHFALPAQGEVCLEIFDLQGRPTSNGLLACRGLPLPTRGGRQEFDSQDGRGGIIGARCVAERSGSTHMAP